MGNTSRRVPLKISVWLDLFFLRHKNNVSVLFFPRFNLDQTTLQEVFDGIDSLLQPWTGTFRPDAVSSVNRIDQCPFPTEAEQMATCDPQSRFRTADGSCNNLEHPLWGKSFEPMGRFLPAVYGDSECLQLKKNCSKMFDAPSRIVDFLSDFKVVKHRTFQLLFARSNLLNC